MDWKIFYDDGTAYTGDPFRAPAFGVLIIVQKDPECGRRLVQNADFYVWDERGEGPQWFEANWFGLLDYLAGPGPKRVLFGRLVPNSVFQAVFARAYDDPGFPPKTAWANQEQRR